MPDNDRVTKLSRLQKFILQQAHKNGVVHNSDILIGWFGFQPVSTGKLKFKRREIGICKYLNHTVAVSRSITRLRLRGLIESSPSYGHFLTSMGQEVAEKLIETVD